MKNSFHLKGCAPAAIAFLAAYGIFQFAYPYHLMRREQQTLFLFDGDYIAATYRGSGWLARLAADFLDQFFGLTAAGPLVIALLLTAIGLVAYRICRKFCGEKISLLIAAAMFFWSLMRETENMFCTRYTIVTLGYLSLMLAALRFRDIWKKAVAVCVAACLGVLMFGTPYNQYYGRLWGSPNLINERVIALDVEASRENWDKVLELSRDDIRINEASYFYNLANAMKGQLGDNLLKHSQHYANSLFLWVSPEVSPFINSIAGETWYHLGNMTLAEQSAIIGMQASPEHTGTRYIRRLAQTNLVSGEYGAAEKYLAMLQKTLFHRGWAEEAAGIITGNDVPEWLSTARKNLSANDIVIDRKEVRLLLKELLEANPGNTMAREYLLCNDLLFCDLRAFMEDYLPDMLDAEIYHEATLIWLNLVNNNDISKVDVTAYGISRKTMDRLFRFYRDPGRFKGSYWYYYMKAMQ